MTPQKVLVLDTSAFIAGFDSLSVGEAQYSVPEVGRELLLNSLTKLRFTTAVDNGRLKIKVPAEEALGRVKEASRKVGDVLFLSDADLQVLALALELKAEGYDPQIVTDDYSIQNVADQLGIAFAPLMTFGIRFRLEWVIYCPACHRKYSSDHSLKSCEVCGTKLKRKPLGKRAVRESE
ncbi:MAG: DNA-binding protein [Candidatus Bathyarchaeota archaeon]|nr:MAG: DNA-binding protein [Candidatus Bathyarchaeota archaeon]